MNVTLKNLSKLAKDWNLNDEERFILLHRIGSVTDAIDMIILGADLMNQENDQVNIEELIRNHKLLPHPEGGFYRETYRSESSTGIFYLLTKGQKSSFHRIKSDEMWHFYGGDSISIVEITNDKIIKETILNKSNVQYVVPANVWFGVYLPEGSKFAFMGCTVAPAFHFSDFEMGSKDTMLAEFPKAKDMIEKLLRTEK